MRQGKPYVLKMVGCDSINEANAALTEASCLQRLNHPNVVRFEDGQLAYIVLIVTH